MTTTIQDVRRANKQWFSLDNKRFFGDIEYRVLHDTFKLPYLVRLTTQWTGELQWKINLISLKTLKIGYLLEQDFESLDDAKRYLKQLAYARGDQSYLKPNIFSAEEEAVRLKI